MIFSSRSLITILASEEPKIDHGRISLKTFLLDDDDQLRISFAISQLQSMNIYQVDFFLFFFNRANLLIRM